MLVEGHIETGTQLEESARELASLAPERHVKAIVELVFGAAHHYISAGLEIKYGEHSDKHSSDSGLLRKHGELKIAEAFESIDRLRAGRFYGRKGNGEAIKQAFEFLAEIRKWLGRG